MKQKLILIDGIIGSGKTFTLSQVEEHPNLYKAVEPVYLYRNCLLLDKSYNALGLYYEYPKENAVCLQLHIIECLERVTQTYPSKVILTERYLTSVYPFTQTMLGLKYISKFSAAFIQQKLSEALSRISDGYQIEKVIFLDTDIGLCMQRWISRERREEMEFTPEEMENYMTLLRSNYLRFYEEHYSDELIVVKKNDLNLIRQVVSDTLEKGQLLA